MQKKQKLFLVISSILILIVLAFFYRSVLEVYYKVTGNIVEENIQWNIWSDGVPPAAVPGPKEEAENKQVCLIKASHLSCTLIRAVYNGQNGGGYDAPVSITCVYGCPK